MIGRVKDVIAVIEPEDTCYHSSVVSQILLLEVDRMDSYMRPVENIKDARIFFLSGKRHIRVKGRMKIATSLMTLNPAIQKISELPMDFLGIFLFQPRSRGEH